MLGKHSTTELQPQPQTYLLFFLTDLPIAILYADVENLTYIIKFLKSAK
jgi:hypothetical protein